LEHSSGYGFADAARVEAAGQSMEKTSYGRYLLILVS
jgi:hypothetical protein